MLRTVLAICLLVLSCKAIAAVEQDGVIKVLVFNSGTTPSEAIKKPHYEFRAVREGAFNAEFLCDICRQKLFPEALPEQGRLILVAQTEPSGIAYICRNCHDLVWRDQGRQLEFTEENDRVALEKLKRELLVTITAPAIAAPRTDAEKKPMGDVTK